MCLIEFSGTWPNPFLQTKGAMLMRCQNADALEALKTLGRRFKAQEGARLVELLKTHIGTAAILVFLLYCCCYFILPSSNQRVAMLR